MARQIYGNDQVLSHADYVPLGVEGCREKAFVSGHFGFAFARPLMEGRYCFTFLRDPHQRLLSLYRYCRSRPDVEGVLYDAASKYDVAGFLQAVLDSNCRGHVWNNQVWQLSRGFGWNLIDGSIGDIVQHDPQTLLADAKRNLEAFDHVGLVETFDADIQKIFSDIGHPGVEIHRSNVTAASAQKLTASGSLARLMDDMTELDRALYDHAMRIRPRRSPARFSWLSRLRARRA